MTVGDDQDRGLAVSGGLASALMMVVLFWIMVALLVWRLLS
jgi:type IV secretory pathway TrbD component